MSTLDHRRRCRRVNLLWRFHILPLLQNLAILAIVTIATSPLWLAWCWWGGLFR